MSRLNEADRDLIVELARAGIARNEIARRTGTSTATVSRIARAANLSFTGAKRTAAATEVRRADLATRRRELAGGVLDDISGIRRALRSALRDGGEPRDLADYARAINLLALTHTRLTMHEPTEDIEYGKTMLGDLMTAFGLTYERMRHDNGPLESEARR
ncbi:MAG TPA: helix-turn-helix domain-containing protein [Mycobacterium sp.]|nr:helix-turn-helix domain-containing protein [Mycobacterium sp.]